ncbi:MAG: DegT/DnrJ/EryC1/StrS family aminotransferase [Patescibacteria group bacterium]
MPIPLVDLSYQYQKIKLKIDDSLYKIFSKGDFILGEEVEKFEKEFARFCKVKYCVGVASGTDAILLSLHAMGVGAGDEVITVPNTFVATVFPIVILGAKPVLSEIDSETYQMDPKVLEKAISKKTKVIIPVHLYGIPAPMDKIMKIARSHNLFVLEDACQAHGSMLNGKKCGSFGDMAAFSFYPAKNLGAAGDGGAVVTNNKDLAQRIKVLRNMGQQKKYHHTERGYNSRLDTLQAAILRAKLRYLDTWNKQRRGLATLYKELLEGLPLVLPKERDGTVSNYHLFVVRSKKRDVLLEYLKRKGVFCGIHYPIPIHMQKSLNDLDYKKGAFPITELYAKEIISLPMYPGLRTEEIEYICSLIQKFFKGNK